MGIKHHDPHALQRKAISAKRNGLKVSLKRSAAKQIDAQPASNAFGRAGIAVHFQRTNDQHPCNPQDRQTK